MIRDDLQPWLSWMPGWLLLPTVAVVTCLLYPFHILMGLCRGLIDGHQEGIMPLRVVRDILKQGEE